MDPNVTEPGNQGGVAVADKPVNNISPDPLSNLQDVVDAAKQAAAAAKTTAPEQTPAETPQGQFENQFGSGVTPPVAETPSSSVAQLDPSINTVDDLLAKGPQVVETQSEVKLPPRVQEFLDSVLNATEKYRASEEEKVASY